MTEMALKIKNKMEQSFVKQKKNEMRMRMENKNKNEILFKNKRNEIMQYNGYSWACDMTTRYDEGLNP